MKILLIGYGAMNQRVARLAEEKNHEIVGVIDRTLKIQHHTSITISIVEAQDVADVVIDFSNPELLIPLLDESFNLPLVIATTGRERYTHSKATNIRSTYACIL